MSADPVGHLATRRWTRRAIPFVVCLVWVMLVGWLIWRHAAASDQPLIGDARGYWMKARDFWGAVAQGRWVNPFNIEPTKRPPGTILLSYPLGFSESFTGYLFRSIFVPLLLVWVAIQVAGRLARATLRQEIHLACISAFVCAAPVFYQFEYLSSDPRVTYWGLVDTFTGASAALAAALALYAAVRPSKRAAVAAGVFADICFSTKPTGLLVVALTGLIWVVAAVCIFFMRSPAVERDQRLRLYRQQFIGLMMYCVTVAPILMVGRFFSNYFSAENVLYGDRAVGYLREDWLLPSLRTLLVYVRETTGPLLGIALVIVLTLGFTRSQQLARQHRQSKVLHRFSAWTPIARIGSICALLFAVPGIWFWLIYSGGSQVRYAYPFMLPFIVMLVPVALELMQNIGARASFILGICLAAPALNITLLLSSLNPPLAWERASGVNVRKIDVAADMSMGRSLLRYARDSGRDVIAYEDFSGRAGILDSFWGFEITAHPALPNVHVANPVDFIRPASFRVREIADADFLLFRVISDPVQVAQHLHANPIDSFNAEEDLFSAWASSLSAHDGVQQFAQIDDLRLLKVVDHASLEQSLNQLMREHQWRAAFNDANPAAWWSSAEIERRPNIILMPAQPIHFEQGLEIRALEATKEADQISVDVWWRNSASTPIDDRWYFFVHELDATGQPIRAGNIRLRAFGEGTDQQFMLQTLVIPTNPALKATTLAVGIFRLDNGNATTSRADSGTRDWGDHRVLVPLP